MQHDQQYKLSNVFIVIKVVQLKQQLDPFNMKSEGWKGGMSSFEVSHSKTCKSNHMQASATF